jgi:hypothetical protein
LILAEAKFKVTYDTIVGAEQQNGMRMKNESGFGL